MEYSITRRTPAWPYAVVFSLVTKYLGAGARQFGFMLRGLVEMEAALAAKNIKFVLLEGKAPPGSAHGPHTTSGGPWKLTYKHDGSRHPSYSLWTYSYDELIEVASLAGLTLGRPG